MPAISCKIGQVYAIKADCRIGRGANLGSRSPDWAIPKDEFL